MKLYSALMRTSCDRLCWTVTPTSFWRVDFSARFQSVYIYIAQSLLPGALLHCDFRAQICAVPSNPPFLIYIGLIHEQIGSRARKHSGNPLMSISRPYNTIFLLISMLIAGIISALMTVHMRESTFSLTNEMQVVVCGHNLLAGNCDTTSKHLALGVLHRV